MLSSWCNGLSPRPQKRSTAPSRITPPNATQVSICSREGGQNLLLLGGSASYSYSSSGISASAASSDESYTSSTRGVSSKECSASVISLPDLLLKIFTLPSPMAWLPGHYE